MSEIFIPFKKEMKQAIFEGRKHCTSRTKQYGDIGDTFKLDDKKYMIVDMKIMRMADITLFLNTPEGFSTTQQFEEYLEKVIGLKWDANRPLFVHWFQEIVEGSEIKI